jgi:archaellum biogenesis protein FlaJ (TadC family)
MLNMLITGTLISMTISNALAPKFALGGHPLSTALFGGITCLMTGANMLLIPPVAANLLNTGAL